MFRPILYLPLNQQLFLYFVELITLIYLLNRYKKSSFYVLVIFLFYQAIFLFLGADINNGYKIIVLLFTLQVSIKRKVFTSFKKGDGLISFLFVLFSISYLYSAYNNGDTLTIILSQYSRFLIAYCLLFLVRKEINNPTTDVEFFKKFIYDVILMQIIITLAKFLFLIDPVEELVGSISHFGGAAGTTLPILGFIMLWFYKKGDLKNKDWLYSAGLLFIGFMAGKRAVWFIMPLVIAAFMIYVPKIKLNKTLIYGILMAPMAFYLGVRLSPSLNPDHKIWGSFDFEYTFDFADKYQFGDKTKKDEKRVQGRGGATMSLWDKLSSDEKLTEKDLFGSGLSDIYAVNYEEFDKLKTGIHSKGSATGIYQTYISNGYVGIFTILLFNLAVLWRIKMKRIRWVIIAIVGWEFIMYTGLIFRTPAFMFLIVYFVHYGNYLMQRKPKIVRSL